MTERMNADAVVDFVSAIVAYDNREPTRAALAAWQESATRGRWTLDEALDALHEHYAVSTEFVMPGHITSRVRAARRDQHEREVAERMTQPPELPAAGYRMSPDLQAVHDDANVRACFGRDQGGCGQPAGQRCRDANGFTRIPCLVRITGRPGATITRRVPA